MHFFVVNYFFYDEPAHVLANVHKLFILEVIIRWRILIYFLRVVGVLLVFSEKLAHVVPIEDRTGYLWHG